VAEFLSPAWLDEVRRAATDSGPGPDVSGRIQWVVTGVPAPAQPDGGAGGGRSEGGREGRGGRASNAAETRFYMVLDHGRPVEVMVGVVDDADITLTVGYDDAVAVVRGELEPSVAFMQGRLKASGDMGLLLGLLPSAEAPEGLDLRRRIAAATTW